MGGQVQVMMALVPEAMPIVKSGRLRALAMTSSKRLPAYPDVPTVAEAGGKDFDMTFWYAFMAPAGTPAAALDALGQAAVASLQAPEVRRVLQEAGFTLAGIGRAYSERMVRSEATRWAGEVKATGFKAD